MTNCLPLQSVNPINQLLLDTFGENYFPPFNAGFQPTNKGNMVGEALLQMQFPGGGKLKPPGEPYETLSAMISGIVGQIGPVFSFFGPLFIILDLIRAIIDIICSLMNPDAMIKSIVDMFLTAIPPIIALYPPLSAILLALNVVKLVTSIIVALTAVIIPIIDQIVECSLLIIAAIEKGDILSIDAITAKICSLLQGFSNQIGGSLAPVSFIIELLDLFMSLGAKFFCAGDSVCCDEDSCPPVIKNPPAGTGTIMTKIEFFGLSTLFLAEAGSDQDIAFVQPSLSIYDPSNSRLVELDQYIVLGDLIKENSDENVTFKVKLTKRTSGGAIERTATLNLYASEDYTLYVRGDDFNAGDIIEYEVLPIQSTLLAKNMMGFGCQDDIAAAASGVRSVINENIDAAAVIGGSGNDVQGAGAAEGFSGLDPLTRKIGRNFPPLPIEDLNRCLAAQTANPAISQSDCVMETVNNYLSDLTDFYEDIVCVGASRTKSVFEISKSYALSDGLDFATISLTVNDISGANMLTGGLPNATIGAEFSATGGTIGPVTYDPNTGIFLANITSDRIGVVDISCVFTVRGKVCMRPGKFDGFAVTDKILSIEFLPVGGAYKRRRKERQYMPSAGGRRR